ncbi:MAG: nuclear transport factor 2 family protein [Pseudomonadota bacterium]
MNSIIKLLALAVIGLFAISACSGESHSEKDTAQMTQEKQTLEVAQSFLEAAGSGDMSTLSDLMADDFVWHIEGDTTLPWIGNWEGKETVLTEFLPAFGAGLQATSWTTDYNFVNGDQAVFIGTMSATATNSGVNTGSFSWAVRVHVADGKVKSWNWFEDSFAVSKAYHAGGE